MNNIQPQPYDLQSSIKMSRTGFNAHGSNSSHLKDSVRGSAAKLIPSNRGEDEKFGESYSREV